MRNGWIHGAVGALLFAAMAQLAHHAPPGLSAWGLLFHRAIVGLVLLTPVVAGRLPSLWGPGAWKVWRRGFLGGIAVFTYFLNLRRTTAGMASVLHQVAPIYVSLLSPLILHTRTPPKALLGAVIAVVGVAVLVSPTGQGLDAGSLALGLGGAAVSGLAYLSLKSASDDFGAHTLVWALSVFLLGFALPFWDPIWIALTLQEWAFAISVGVLSVLAQTFMTMSYKSLSAPTAATLTLTGAVWTLLYDVLSGDMRLNSPSVIGVLCILGGIAVTHRFSRS